MYTSEYISQLCGYYGIPDRQITVFDRERNDGDRMFHWVEKIKMMEGLHAVIDRLDEAADLDTKGFFQQPHAGAYTVGIRLRMHEDHIWTPRYSYFWLGAEGGAIVMESAQ